MIIYEINTINHNYDLLYSYLKSYKVWWHYLSNVWIVGNGNKDLINIDDICKTIKLYLEEEDKVFICEINPKQCNGWLPKKAWEWLKTNEVNSNSLT